MRRALVVLVLLAPSLTTAQDLLLADPIAADAPPYFALPFTVPEGTVEIEVRHDDLSDANILDWGLRDPERFRGWGGGNVEPAIVGVEAASRSYLRGPIPAGEWAVLIGQARVREPPAQYRIEIFFRTAPTLAPQTERMPYAPSTLATGPAWYAGDFHVHSIESGDARPPLDEIADFAAARGLDFVELSDHNVVSQLDFIVDAQARHPGLLFVPGIEVTTYFGHANAIGATQWIDFQVESGTSIGADTIAAAAMAQNAVLSINHPVLDLGDMCIGCAWALDVPVERVGAIEIANGAYSVTGALFYAGAVRFWEERLANGAHVAAIGGSDDHQAGVEPGTFGSVIGSPTTMVYASELSAAAIVDGVRSGRTVVKLEGPDDPMLELTAGAAMIGDTVRERSVELRAVVSGGAGTTLYFVQNGRRLDPIMVDADPFVATRAIAAPPGTLDDRWRAELYSGGTPRVVTSHIWIAATGEPPDAGSTGSSGGCGCRIGARASYVAWIALLWLAAILRRRRAIAAS